jgi:curved DNA-binding protein CbpA
VKKRDPKGYYAVLNISPEASHQEIRLAYSFLKQAYKDGKKNLNIGLIQAAYETLSDSEQRDLYDKGGASSRSGGRSRLHSVPLLVTLLVVLLGVLAFAVGPVMKAHFTTFDAGAELYWKRTGKPVGVVLAYDPAHEFESGAATPAYQVEIRSGAEPVWFSAWDLNRNCERR